MQVPLLDLKPQYLSMAAEIHAAIEKVCASQHFILGPAVKELEASIASYSQCRHGIGLSSGTDALLVALMALGIGPGDAVITSPFTFFATAGTIARVSARPLFCDIDPVTFNLSPAALETFLEKHCERRGSELLHRGSGAKVRALMPVHLYGQVADMVPLMASARRYGLKVIEDAAQAIGAADAEGKRAGSFGRKQIWGVPTDGLGAILFQGVRVALPLDMGDVTPETGSLGDPSQASDVALAIKQATGAGAKVIAWAADPSGTAGTDYVSYVDWNVPASGTLWANWMVKALHGNGKNGGNGR